MEIRPEISIRIRQFNYGRNGGSASAILLGLETKSAFDDRPYAAIEIGFSLWNVEPPVNPELQVLHMVPDSRTGRSYLLIGFIQETAVPRGEADFLLADTSYRGKIAKMALESNPTINEIGHEETFHRRTDHWFPAGSRGRNARCGALPQTRLFGSRRTFPR